MSQSLRDASSSLPHYHHQVKNSDDDLTRLTSKGDDDYPRDLPPSTDKKPWAARDIMFKVYVIVSMTFVWSAYTLTLRYTRTRTDRLMYFSTTVVFLAEVSKFFMAAFLLWRTHRYSIVNTRNEIRSDFFTDLRWMAVPSLAYAAQNNIDFIALANLDAGVYQVTCQLKIVTTAIFMVLLLHKRYSMTRWLAIVLLFGGVALVQLNALNESSAKSTSKAAGATGDDQDPAKQNHLLGIAAVLITCCTAGFAGVWFERMLKDQKASLWIRNLQMYACGIISAGLGCLFYDGKMIMEDGFFRGYDPMVCSIVVLLSVGGIYISLVIKYLDNLLKSFASAVSISVVSLLSAYIFGTSLGLFFLLGSATVCGAILLYSSVPE